MTLNPNRCGAPGMVSVLLTPSRAARARTRRSISAWSSGLMNWSAPDWISSTGHGTRTGHRVPENTFDQIEPGKTTAAWVAATLGQPAEKNRIDEQSEIWKWKHSQTKSSSGYVFLLFTGSDTTETPGAAFVEFKNGGVVRKWRN